MGKEKGLYECVECEYREYKPESDEIVGSCPRCDGEMKQIAIR
jgi:Zn finger protein HypA/HybF involved in hydrogenase expression